MKKIFILMMTAGLLSAASCTKDKNGIATCLGNDCINKSYYAPYIVGQEILFSYASFMPYGSGRIAEVSVSCNIPGAEGTYLDNYAYSADEYGQDLPHRMGSKCVTSGNKYTVTFDVDTVAATLRFHYIIPEEARGAKVNFHFSVRSSDGQTATFDTPNYQIRKMTMKLDIPLTTERCFVSLERLEAFSKAEAESGNVPIDFLWGYSGVPTDKGDRNFFGNPARVSQYSAFFTAAVPSTVRDTPKMYRYTILEGQLARQEFDGFYIDDRDFESLKLDCDTDVLIGISNRNGFWIESSDGKYRAYVYCNSYSSDKCTISIKRYTVL